MMALFGSVAHAPLAVMLMVAEMTGNLSMLAPAMVAVGLATFVVGTRTIYRSQLATRADSPAQQFRFALPLLAAVPVGGAARQARVVLRGDDTVQNARMRIESAGVPGAPVVGRDGIVLGMIDLDTLHWQPTTTLSVTRRSSGSRSSARTMASTMPLATWQITVAPGRQWSQAGVSRGSCRCGMRWRRIARRSAGMFGRFEGSGPVA